MVGLTENLFLCKVRLFFLICLTKLKFKIAHLQKQSSGVFLKKVLDLDLELN